MKQRADIGLVALGAGILTVGIWAATSVFAASTQSTVDMPVSSVTTTAATTIPAMPMAAHHHQRLNETAELFGITADELTSALQSGKEFYQIAAEHGVTFDKLKANREQEVKARLDDMVKVGYLTQEQADKQWKLFQEREEEMPMMMGMGGHHFRGHGFGM